MTWLWENKCSVSSFCASGLSNGHKSKRVCVRERESVRERERERERERVFECVFEIVLSLYVTFVCTLGSV